VITGAPQTAAQTHAVLRARSGFDIIQLAAEYRAPIRVTIRGEDADVCVEVAHSGEVAVRSMWQRPRSACACRGARREDLSRASPADR
jgi:hypothetical protein